MLEARLLSLPSTWSLPSPCQLQLKEGIGPGSTESSCYLLGSLKKSELAWAAGPPCAPAQCCGPAGPHWVAMGTRLNSHTLASGPSQRELPSTSAVSPESEASQDPPIPARWGPRHPEARAKRGKTLPNTGVSGLLWAARSTAEPGIPNLRPRPSSQTRPGTGKEKLQAKTLSIHLSDFQLGIC